MGRGLQLASGRVIALGRLLLVVLFLTALSLDASQPAQFSVQTYAVLIVYLGLAVAVVIATWNSWWLDAHLAGPAHAIDIALFTTIVYFTHGDTSPYFAFFVFVLLSAAIRWGWRATALTAILLTLLYLVAGLITAASNSEFDLNRFVTGTGYLVILSLILIWFGVNQWRARLSRPAERLLTEPSINDSPHESSLRAAMAGAGSPTGAFTWSKQRDGHITTLLIGNNGTAVPGNFEDDAGRTASTPFLYDLPRARALLRDQRTNLRSFDPRDSISTEAASMLGLREGLAIPVSSPTGQGQLYLEQVRGLSTDHLELGAQIGIAVAANLQRHALMKAAEESAESRSRLAVARDLHDSVVQFLAGAAFRLEAMKRSEALGRDVTSDLDELKQLMLQEQGELRSFITVLRTGSQIELAELARELQSVASRLSRQWNVQCTFSLQPDDVKVPTRLHLDAPHLVREAVANAVRHAGARNISILLSGKGDEILLEFINDGAPYPETEEGRRMPASLQERVEAAGGAIELSQGMGVTKVSISLPTARNAA